MKPDEVLARTAKGLQGLDPGVVSATAARLFAAIDGRSGLASLGGRMGASNAAGLQGAAAELVDGGYAHSLGVPQPLSAQPQDATGDLITLDFTRQRATQKLRQAAQLALLRETQRVEDEKRSARARAQAEREAAALRDSEAREAQAKLEAEARGMLVKILRPRVEEALRVKLVSALRPQIEAELREKLAAALRPRVELELRARFARQLAELKAKPGDPPAERPEPVMEHGGAAGGVDEPLLGCLGEAVFAADALGVLLRVNPAWSQLTGWEATASTGKSLAEFFAEPGRAAVAKFLARIAQGSAVSFSHVAALERVDGSQLWVELRAAPFAGPEGASGVCGVVLDATEARRTAAEAEDAALRLLLLVDESDAGVVIEDERGAVRQVNPGFCTLFGVQAAPFSFEGAAIADLLHEAGPVLADLDALLARMAAIRAAAEDIDAEPVALAGSATALLSYRPTTSDGPPRGHIWIFRARGPS